MQITKISFVALLFTFLFSGCTTYKPINFEAYKPKPLKPNETRITFDTNPPGATISTPGHNWGTAPVQLFWSVNVASSLSEPITATWISGATTTTPLKLIGGQEGSYILQRPQEAPNIDIDIRWAIHIQQLAQQKRQANDAEFDSMMQTYRNNNTNSNAPVTNKNTYCTSSVIGTQVFTNCY